MRVLSWNVNHRGSRRRIPAWVSAAIGEKSPDVLVLTEYIEGPDHAAFLEDLHASGLKHSSITERPVKSGNHGGRAGKLRFERQNQLLIVTREPHRCGNVQPPALHVALPSNVLHITLSESKVSVLGFRMPAYDKSRVAYRRQTWDWLLSAAAQIVDGPSIITGDFNTDPHDGGTTGGRCLDQLSNSGWYHARPQEGYSYRPNPIKGVEVRERVIDHTFVSHRLKVKNRAMYDWEFLTHLPDTRCIAVGCPDHAMLITDIGIDVVVPASTLTCMPGT